MIILSVVVLAGCYKSKFSDTLFPDDGVLSINIVLPTLATDDSEPTSYTIVVDGQQSVVALDDGVTLYPAPLEPGEYYIYVYSNSASVAIEDLSSTVGTITATAPDDGGSYVKTLPEHIYFGMQRVTITADTRITTDVSMAQISRDIHFSLYIAEGDPDRISSVTSSLTGVTQAWECIGDTAYDTGLTTIDPALTQGAYIARSTGDNDYISGSIRVFGVTGTEQKLTIELTYSDDTKQTILSDITQELKDANINKSTDIILTGNINTPIETEVDGTIDNWTQENGDPQTAK